MTEWKKVKLGDVVEIEMGQSPESIYYNSTGDGLPFLQGNRTFGLRNPTFDTFTTKVTKQALCNDVIMSVRAPVGDLNITPQNICIGRGICALRMKTDCQSFLFYLMKYLAPQLIKRENGTIFGSVNRNDITNLELSLPPLPTQKKIAEVLSCLDAQIELNRRINENLEQQAGAIFKEWFVDFGPFAGKMPDDWKEGYLDDIVEFVNGYAFDSKSLLKEPKGECYDVFKQGHIKRGGGFNIDGTKSWFPKENTSKLEKYILKKGDILMAMTDMKGNVAILGNTAIMEVDDKYILNQRVGLLRCKKELGISFPYLYLLTNSFDFNNDLRQRANSGVQVNLSTEAIKKSKIYIAPKKINIQFDSLVKPLYEEMIHNDLESCNLAQIRDTLLPKLMNGELEV